MGSRQRQEVERLTSDEANAILADVQLRQKFDNLGIDLGLLVENLTCSSAERFERHANALRMAWAFKQAGEEARA
jgi:hypothetical protein